MQRADLEKVDGGTGWDCLSKTGNNKQQAEYMTETKWIERRSPVLVDPPGRRPRSERLRWWSAAAPTHFLAPGNGSARVPVPERWFLRHAATIPVHTVEPLFPFLTRTSSRVNPFPCMEENKP
jgi:hypothetical protein